MIFHLGKPGARVEEVIVAAPVHQPGSLGHQALLQEVAQAAGQDLPRPPDKVEAAGVKLPDHDDAGLQRQWLVLLPQQVTSAGGRVLEVVRVDDAPHALPGGHQRPPDVQIPAERIIVLGYRSPDHGLTAKIPGSEVDNVSGTGQELLMTFIPDNPGPDVSPSIDIVQLRGPHVIHRPAGPSVPHKHPRTIGRKIFSLIMS